MNWEIFFSLFFIKYLHKKTEKGNCQMQYLLVVSLGSKILDLKTCNGQKCKSYISSESFWRRGSLKLLVAKRYLMKELFSIGNLIKFVFTQQKYLYKNFAILSQIVFIDIFYFVEEDCMISIFNYEYDHYYNCRKD